MKQLLSFATRPRLRMRRKSPGQSLAEFALVLPTLLLFIMGVVDFGRMLFTYSQASSQLRQALRMASVIGYDPSATPPYRDCDLMRSVASNVFFASPITPTVTYYDQYTDWNGTDFTGGTVCPNTGGADVGPTGLENGDVVRISEDITIQLITPFFVPSVTFNLTGQRTIVTEIVLVSMPRCGDRICQSGESSCPADCVGTDNPPSVNILNPPHGAPCTNSPVSGTVHVEIAASDSEDPVGSLTVEFNDGSGWVAASWDSVNSVYYFDWNTMSLTNGTPYNLQAQATDVGGSTVVSTVHCVVINNTVNTAPTASITSPTTTVSGAFTVRVNATDVEDSAGTLTVAITVDDGTNPPVTLSTPTDVTFSAGTYNANFNTSSFPGATSVTISVLVTDSGALTASAGTTVPAGGCAGNCTPTVIITSPASGATVMGSVNVDITATDESSAPLSPVQVTIVQVSTGTTVVSANASYLGANNYRYPWNAASATNGQYTITASYNDGSSTGSQTITVTVSNSVSYHTNGLSWTHTGTQPNQGSYTATIVVTMVDNNGAPLSGVTVVAIYGSSASSQPNGTSCTATTNASGQCTIVIPASKTDAIYIRVYNAVHATKTYDPASNIPPVPTLCYIPAPGNDAPPASGNCP